MASFLDDLRTRFIPLHGAIAELILINVAVFVGLGLVRVVALLFQVSPLDLWTDPYFWAISSDPMTILRRPYTLLTFQFLHAGFFHILFNMLWLFWLGSIFRSLTSNATVWATYVMGSLAGALLLVVAYQVFPFFRGQTSVAVGASAGVMALMVGTGVLAPNLTLNMLFFGPVKLKWLVLVFVVLDLLRVTGENAGGHLGHLGGAIYGFVAATQLKQGGTRLGQPVEWLYHRLRNASWQWPSLGRSRRSRGGTGQAGAQGRGTVRTFTLTAQDVRQPAGSSGQVTEAEFNRILDKINAKGIDSLSPQERETLRRYGRR